MVRYLRRILVPALAAAVLTLVPGGCATDYVENGRMVRQVFVDVGGAILPVAIAGRAESDVAIVFVHGGPGNSGELFRQFRGLYDLEDYYKVIYYDQRGSGMTQGNTDPDDLTIEKFADDLDVIVDFTREVAGAETIYIMGHSWGGGLSTYYLLDAERQQKIRGYIAVAPAFNIVNAMANSRQWVINIAEALVALNIDRNYWQGALDYYAAHPVIRQDDFFDHSKYVDKADGITYSDRDEVDIDLPDFQLQAYAANFLYAQEHLTVGGQPIFDALELDAEMDAITLPVALLWGERDGLIPVSQAADFEAAIGTPGESFIYVGFPESAHEPMAEEPGDFTNVVRTFVELTR